MIFNFFPLTIYKEKAGLDDAIRQKFAAVIASQSKQTAEKQADSGHIWVGGVHGELSLHLTEDFQPLFGALSKHIKLYMDQLGFQRDDLDIFVTRSWGTFGQGDEMIANHMHSSSALSIAYYVSLPEGSAAITFENDRHQSEPVKGMFRESLLNRQIDPRNPLSALNVSVRAEEDDLLIFPSSVLHGVRPGKQKAPRISISADTLFLTKTVTNSEKILPPVSNWKNVSW